MSKTSPKKFPGWDYSKIPSFIQWNRLKALRRKAGLTQAKLAVAADVSHATIFYLEAGHEEKISDSTKQKLADYFGCQVDELFPVVMVGKITQQEYLERKIKEDEAAGRIPGE